MLETIYRGHEQAGFFAHALMAQQAEPLLSRLPGNARTDDARYACLVPVRDYHRMLRSESKNKGEWHYSDLEPEILQDVREGRAVIVLDLTNEGPAYAPHIFAELYDWIEAERLPAGRVIWLAQNRNMQARAREDVGERAGLVRFMHFDFFVRAMAWLFSPLAPEPVLGTDPEAAVARLVTKAVKDKLLLCLNATPRLHRVLTVAALHHHHLVEGSLVSFPGLQYVKEGASIDAVIHFVDANPLLHYLRPWLEVVRNMEDLRVDNFEEKGNALFSKIDVEPYVRSYFSLVTESDFSNGLIDRISEKVPKSFCMGHPTLVVGNPDSIKFVTELGFQDWPGLDRALEQLNNPAERFEAVMRDVLRQTLKISTNPAGWRGAMREVSSFNIRHAVSGGMMNAYLAKYDRPLVEQFQALVQV